MPQVRDPKTGRYTSGGGSSYEAGANAGTNPRIQKAKAMGDGGSPWDDDANDFPWDDAPAPSKSTPEPKTTKMSTQQAASAVSKLNLNSNPNITVYTDEYMSGVKVTFEGKLGNGKAINLWESNFLSTQAQIDELPGMYEKQSAELNRLRSIGYKGL